MHIRRNGRTLANRCIHRARSVCSYVASPLHSITRMSTKAKTPAELIESGQFEEIVVTDIDWLFDGGIREGVSLRDEDTIQYDKAEGVINVILESRIPNGFPECFTYQIGKIIGQRTAQRRMKVAIPDFAWRQHQRRHQSTAAAASGSPPAGRGSSRSADSSSPGSTARVGLSHRSSRVSQVRQPQPPQDTPRYDSRAQQAVQTSGPWRGADRSRDVEEA
jgi:hypothetical protein